MIDAQLDTLAGVRNKALLSLDYDFLARRSELVALRTTDLEFTRDGALKGMIRKSKTDQYGRGRLVFGSERSAKLLRAWFRKNPKEIEAVFCSINHGKCLDRPICDRNVNEIIKKSVVKVKRSERPSDLEVSGHSLRVGAAQDLLIKGYDLAAIMRAGGGGQMQELFPGICGFRSIIFGASFLTQEPPILSERVPTYIHCLQR
jgi:integrase/recombinase XerD